MRIIISKYKSLLAPAALAAVLTAFFVNGPLAAPMTKAEPAAIQQQTPAPGTLSIIAILIGLVERQVAIYVPSGYRAGTAVPLVFALHGGGGDASKMYNPDKRIVEYAESQGFIAVFPNGLPLPGAPTGSDKYYWNDPANIGFINHLIDLMTDRFTINSRRVYFIGFSGGAKLCYRLAANPAISERIAAIATVAGDMGSKPTNPPTSPWEIIDPAASGGAPMSALLLEGGEDKRRPVIGGFEEDFDAINFSFQAKVDSWRLFVGAIDGTSNTILFGAPARVEVMQYTNPASGHIVISALDPALPHKWPEWNFMGAIWDFFERAPTR
jgi:poly(3-hydroxybutyrate) depolymerase